MSYTHFVITGPTIVREGNAHLFITTAVTFQGGRSLIVWLQNRSAAGFPGGKRTSTGGGWWVTTPRTYNNADAEAANWLHTQGRQELIDGVMENHNNERAHLR